MNIPLLLSILCVVSADGAELTSLVAEIDVQRFPPARHLATNGVGDARILANPAEMFRDWISQRASTNAQGKLVFITDEEEARKTALLPVIEVRDEVAIAKNARHTVEFRANLNEEGSVTIRSEDGIVLRGRPVALTISDGTGKRIVLGEAKDCEGKVTGNAEVLYSDAFVGIQADVVYKYGLKTAFEQDIILRENPVLPPEIDASSARLEVWTEFLNPPEPRKSTKQVVFRRGDLVRGERDVVADDEVLDFGPMRMITGRTFGVEGQKSAEPPTGSVLKLWIPEKGKALLLESADLPTLKPELEKLDVFRADASRIYSVTNLAFSSAPSQRTTPRKFSGVRRTLLNGVQREGAIALARRGVVIDYTLVYNSLLNINFGVGHTGSAAVSRTSNESDVWNSIYTPSQPSGSLGPLVWSDGTPVDALSEVVLENAPGHWGNSTANGMMNDYVYPHNGGSLFVRLNNIPAGTYDIYIYGVWGNVGSVNGRYVLSVGGTAVGGQQETIPGPTWAALNWAPNEHYVVYSGVSVAAGQQILVEGKPASSVAIINGMQLVTSGSQGNAQPQISAIADQSTYTGTPVGPISFTISDAETAAGSLVLSANSGNTSLLPNGNITFGGSGENRTITLAPASGQTGSALVTVTVTDGNGASASERLTLAVVSGSGSFTPLITGVSIGGYPRHEWSYWIGFQFTVGASPITVRELGRWVLSGNSQSHTVKLFNSNGTAVPGGETTVTTAGKTPGAFTYAPLSAPVTLQAGTTYSVMSLEPIDGDYWYHNNYTPITLSGAAHTPVSSWAQTYDTTYNLDMAGVSYGPVDLRYEGGGMPTVATPTITPGSGTYSGAQTVSISCATSGATIYYGINQSNPTTVYSGPFPLSSSATIYAKATKSGMTDSSVASSSITITSNPDSDSDGLLDSWEMTYFRNLSQNGSGDWEGDGITNGQEHANGTNPVSFTGLLVFTPLQQQ